MGETIKVTQNVYLINLHFFKPIYGVPSNAQNVKVALIIQNDSSKIYKEIAFERYTFTNYGRLKDYVFKACSPNEEGYIPVDQGFIFTETSERGNFTIETKKGYCELYQDVRPTPDTDLILINHTYLSIPLEYFRITYDRIRDPLNNGVRDPYHPYIVNYYLPKDAWIWDISVNRSKIEHLLPDGRILLQADYSKVNATEIYFTYGTKSEYKDKDSLVTNLLISLVGVLLAFLGIFEVIKYFLYRRISTYGFIIANIIFLVLIHTIFYVFAYTLVFYYFLIPPFYDKYVHALLLIYISFFGIYSLLFLPLFLTHRRCEFCHRVFRKNYLQQHKTKCPQVSLV